MTAPMEFEEPEAVEASHLVRTRCRLCGTAEAMSTPERASVARCSPCLATEVGVGGAGATALLGHYSPAVGYSTPWLPPHVALENVPYPAPDVTSRDIRLPDMPTPAPAMKLREEALELGWQCVTAYSRGSMAHGTTGRPTAQRHLISVRFGGHPMTDRQAYAVYSKTVTGGAWSWSSVWVWGPKLPPFGQLGITELRSYLSDVGIRSTDEALILWCDDLRIIRQNAAELTKRKAATRPATSKRKEGLS